MATGLPTAKIEIEFTAGVWTDVTTDVRMAPGIPMPRGRADEFGTVQAGTCTITLENIPDPTTGIAKYTPDNPLSAYYPNIVEGKRLRVTLTHSAINYVRFLGYVTAWTPTFPGELNFASVTVSAVDMLGEYANQTLRSDYLESIAGDNPTLGFDAFMFGDPSGSKTARNYGAGNVATVFAPHGTAATFESDASLNLEGVMVTSGIAAATPAATKGPVLVGSTGSLFPVAIQFWVKTTAANASGGFYVLMQGAFDPAQWIVSLAGTDMHSDFFGSVVIGTASLNDGLWHKLAVLFFGGVWNCYEDGVFLGTAPLSGSASAGAWQFGGLVSGITTADCLPAASFAGLAFGYDSAIDQYEQPSDTLQAQARFTELASRSPLTGSTTVTGSANPDVLRTNTVGVTLASALQELATTTGGFIWCDPTGTPTYLTSDASRSKTVAATITLESDDDATGGFVWKRAVDSIPAGVTASSPLGSVFAGSINGRQTSVTTCAASLAAALSAATALLTVSAKLRIATLTVDLSTAQTDLYAALMALKLGGRLRIGNLPSGAFGYTYRDVYVQGWTETLTDTAYTFDFDCTPADDPPFALFDDGTYGRFASAGATITGGTCVGNTGTGTVIVTTSSGPTWTTTGGSYPMDLDWNGERITVNAPGGSSSPQTFTVTARGKAPTVARVHATGEEVNVAYAAAFAF